MSRAFTREDDSDGAIAFSAYELGERAHRQLVIGEQEEAEAKQQRDRIELRGRRLHRRLPSQ